MSLLEDVFLRDEADEAQELERVIEYDEYDERPQRRSDSDDDSEQSNEAEEDKRKVDPASTKARRVIKNPRFVLNPARLTGPRGIHVIPEHFKDFKFKGKGHEREDLDLILKKLEHWAYRLYPKFQFEDCLKKIEILGKKRPVMVNLHKIRSDQFTNEEPIVQTDSSDEEIPQEDEFDKLLQQQIDLARASEAKTNEMHSPVRDKVSLPTTPLQKASPSSPSMNDEQKERMMRNRKLAEERRKERIAKSVTNEVIPGLTDKAEEENEFIKENVDLGRKKINKCNIIESSDEEIQVMNESITVDVHNGSNQNNKEDYINDCKDKGVIDIGEDKCNNDLDEEIVEENDLNKVTSEEIEKSKEMEADIMEVDDGEL